MSIAVESEANRRVYQPGTLSEAKVVDLFYDAAAEPLAWDDALTALADWLGSTSAIFVAHRQGCWSEPRFADFGRLDRTLNMKASREDFGDSPLMPKLGSLGLGQIASSEEIMPADEARRTRWYREMMAPQDIGYCLMTPLLRDHATFGAFFVARSERSGGFPPAEIARLERLIPHLRRVAQIRCHVDSYRALAGEHQALTEMLDTGIVLIDEQGAARCINSAAEAIVAGDGSLRLRSGRLSIAQPNADAELRRLIAAAAAGGAGDTLAVARPDSAQPLFILVCPVRGKMGDRLGGKRRQVALFIKDPSRRGREGIGDGFERCHRLTPCEIRVARTLAAGQGVAGTAQSLGISANTVKMHAKRVYEKLGVDGQVQLARLYANLDGPAPAAA